MTTVDPSGSQRVARQGVWPSGPVHRAKDNRASAAFGHALRSFTYDTNGVEIRPRPRSGTGALAVPTPVAAGGLVGQPRAHTVTTTVDVGNMPAAVGVSPGTNDN